MMEALKNYYADLKREEIFASRLVAGFRDPYEANFLISNSKLCD